MQYIQAGELLVLRPDAPRPRDDLLKDEQIVREKYGRDTVTANVLRQMGAKYRYYLKWKDSNDPERPERWVTTGSLGQHLLQWGDAPRIATYPESEVLAALRRLRDAGIVEAVRGHGWALTDAGARMLGCTS